VRKASFLLALGSCFLTGALAAPGTYFGVRLSGETTANLGVGAQVTYDADRYALRLGLNAKSFLGFTLGLGGDVSALFPLAGTQSTRTRLQAGGGLDLERHNGLFTVIRPHLLLNGEARLARFLTVFAEGSVGYALTTTPGGTQGAFAPGLRVGMNFR